MDGPIGEADPASRDCIDRNVEYEVAFWASHFGISQDQLLEIITIVGPRISDVTAEVVILR